MRRKDGTSKQVVKYKPPVNRKTLKPTETCRRSIERELEENNMTWIEIEKTSEGKPRSPILRTVQGVLSKSASEWNRISDKHETNVYFTRTSFFVKGSLNVSITRSSEH